MKQYQCSKNKITLQRWKQKEKMTEGSEGGGSEGKQGIKRSKGVEGRKMWQGCKEGGKEGRDDKKDKGRKEGRK